MYRKFYPCNPNIKSIYRKIVNRKGTEKDFQELSADFVVANMPIIETDHLYDVDNTVSYLKEKKCYVARRSGYVFINENKLQVIPFVNVSASDLFSFIVIPVNGFTKSRLTNNVIQKELGCYNFKKNTDEDMIASYIAEYNKSGGFQIIHKGIPMVPYRINDIVFNEVLNINFETFLNREDRHTLSVEEIMFHCQVKRGDNIGEWKERISGRDGENVFGETIPSYNIESHYKLGDGLEKQKNGTINATRDGILRINHGRILSVRDTVVIDTELKNDFTNNDKKDVIISGMIDNNINIQVKGNLVIIGSIEKVHIECGSDLLVSKGINNHSIARVEGNCTTMFIANSTLVGGGYLHINQYLMNSNVKIAKNIKILSQNFGEIVGGVTETIDGMIETNVAGSIAGISTFLKVANEFIPKKEVNKKYLEEKLVKQKILIDEKIKKLNLKLRINFEKVKGKISSLSNEEKNKFKKEIEVLKKLQEKSDLLTEEMKREKLAAGKGGILQDDVHVIKIYEEVFDGVHLEIKNVKFNFVKYSSNPYLLRKHPKLPQILINKLSDE